MHYIICLVTISRKYHSIYLKCYYKLAKTKSCNATTPLFTKFTHHIEFTGGLRPSIMPHCVVTPNDHWLAINYWQYSLQLRLIQSQVWSIELLCMYWSERQLINPLQNLRIPDGSCSNTKPTEFKQLMLTKTDKQTFSRLSDLASCGLPNTTVQVRRTND